MKKVLIGIDAGTSSVKVCAFTLLGSLVDKITIPQKLILSNTTWAEINPLQCFQDILGALSSLIKKNELEILGIGFSTACPCLVCMDSQGNALGNAITYLDNRASKELNEYFSNFDFNETSYAKTVGNRASISTAACVTLKWIKSNNPNLWENTKKIGMLNSYLSMQLTGSSAIDYTQASYTGIFKLSKPNDWDLDLIQLADLEAEKLLPILPSFEKVGVVKAEIASVVGMSSNVPVAIGSGDTAAAAFGLGIKSPNQVFESVGTSGVLTFVLDEAKFNPLFMNRCHVIPGLWLSHGATSTMGGSMDWLRSKIFTEYKSPADLDKISEKLHYGAHGLVFLPYLSGERSPIWDSKAKAVWYGLTLDSDKFDMIESVYESGAFALKQILDFSQNNWQKDIHSIIAIGNGTKSRYWSQLKSDVFQLPYHTTSFADASSYGAALMGGCAAKIFSSPTDSSIPTFPLDGIKYEPATEDFHLKQNKEIFDLLYPQLKNIMNNY